MAWGGNRRAGNSGRSGADETVALRRYPYPYRAAAVICSDIDSTRTVERFLAIQQFLNTNEETPMGPGLGLEIGNSFFPFPEDDTFGFFCSRRRDRDVLAAMIEAGFVDCFHSWGGTLQRTRREHVLRGLHELEESGCRVRVWVDHSLAPTNFGKDTTPGVGDVKGSPYYHADATLAYGVRFAWMGRASAIVGQGVPLSARSFGRIFDPHHAHGSARSLGCEAAKTALGWAGSGRFALHAGNRLLRTHTLADGQRIYEFQRWCDHWRGAAGVDAAGLAYALRPQALRALVESEGVSIIYAHLGRGPEGAQCLPVETRAALRHLAAEHRAGRLHVATTSRLLTYYLNHRCLLWSHETDERGVIRLHVQGVADPLAGRHTPSLEDLQGITFYVPDSQKAEIIVGQRLVQGVERNPSDHTGRPSVTIPRTRLRYPLPVVG